MKKKRESFAPDFFALCLVAGIPFIAIVPPLSNIKKIVTKPPSFLQQLIDPVYLGFFDLTMFMAGLFALGFLPIILIPLWIKKANLRLAYLWHSSFIAYFFCLHPYTLKLTIFPFCGATAAYMLHRHLKKVRIKVDSDPQDTKETLDVKIFAPDFLAVSMAMAIQYGLIACYQSVPHLEDGWIKSYHLEGYSIASVFFTAGFAAIAAIPYIVKKAHLKCTYLCQVLFTAILLYTAVALLPSLSFTFLGATCAYILHLYLHKREQLKNVTPTD